MVFLVLLFILVPIAEIYVIIQVGQAIGALWTVLILIVDSIIGARLLSWQGRRAWLKFQSALAEILPLHMPEYLLSRGADGAPRFDVPGFDLRSPDYLILASEGEAPLSEELNLRSVNRFPKIHRLQV